MTDLRHQLQATLHGSYTLEREIGGGGMSRVFLAHETALSRRVVVKVLPPELVAGVNVDRFKREIVLAAQLQHPHIVPVHTAGETNGLPFYTMPFVEGESLRGRLSSGPLAIGETVAILRDVAKALAYAHDRGVVHRDIKPDNVLISGGSAVVTDFGIAKAISAARTNPTATLTQVGTALGTPAYMAPEQAAADPSADHRVDIYAFGCMAYELLTGQPPFAGKSPQRMLAAQMSETPQPVTELRPDTPPALAELVMQCLAKDAADRPARAADLLRSLDTVTSGGSHDAMPAVLLGGRGMFGKALIVYALSFIAVAIVAKAAIVSIGLPDWVFPGALIMMALGLPVILFTAYVHRATRRVLTATPTYTPGGSRASGTMGTLALKASPHVSWRRTTLGGVFALGAFIVLIAGFMVLRAMGIGPAGSLFAAGRLKHNEPLLVADFDVKGGADSSLGPVLSEAVRADLGQSSAVTVVPASAIRSALQRLQKPITSPLSLALMREIAQRDGIKAVVKGEAAPLGAGFIVTESLVAGESGDELASFRATADGPRDLLPTIETLTRQLRGKIGESLRDVHASPPLIRVTTPSLDALKKFQEGQRLIDINQDFVNGIASLKQAIAIDSQFAEAWRKLGVAYSNGSYPGRLTLDAIDHAYRFRDRMTEIERLNTTAYYFDRGRGRDRAKAADAYEAIAQRFGPQNNQALLYESRRDLAHADSAYRAVIMRGGAPRVSYGNLVSVLAAEGRLAAAESLNREEERQFPNAPTLSSEYLLMYLRGQADSSARFLDHWLTAPSPTSRAVAAINRADLAQVRGQFTEGSKYTTAFLAANSARGAGSSADTIDVMLRRANTTALVHEQPARAIPILDSVAARARAISEADDRPYLPLAAEYADAGRPDRARAILAEFTPQIRDTSLKRSQEPSRHVVMGDIALAENRPLEAVREYRLSDQLPDGPVQLSPLFFYANIGRAFDHAGNADSAVAYFERYLNTPMLSRPSTDALYAAAIHKRLGELYEARGDKGKAIAQYQQFVELWKNADADLQPRVAEVRRRIARLADTERR